MKKENKYNGLNPDMAAFMHELAANNNKEWFDSNRKRYTENVREPLKGLVTKMGDSFMAEDMPYAADTRKAIFRINRDIRFSKNKDPYKNNLGLFFPFTENQQVGRSVESLGLYLHYEEKECFIAGGIHCPNPAMLKNIREHISDEFEEFLELINSKDLTKNFPQILLGDKLKSMPRGFSKEDPAADYLKHKEFTFLCPIKHEELYSKAIEEKLIKKGKALLPILSFLSKTT